MKKKYIQKGYWLRFTVLFALFMLAVFAVFWKEHKNFVWSDGYLQYMPYLEYTGKYLRDFLQRALHGDFSLKMFDFTIGYGDDVLTVVKGHPLDLLSILVPGAYTEVLYMALMILRLYLAGAAFSLFCFYWELPQAQVLPGAFVYMFCGNVLRMGIIHPTFLSTMIMLPLLLLAAERFMNHEGHLMFPLMVCLGFMSNYYFMYMNTIVLVIYILLRFPDVVPVDRVKGFFRLFFTMAGAYLLGTAMAAATLLPMIYALTSSSRLSSEGGAPLASLWVYELKRYYRWFVDLAAPTRRTGSITHLNLAAPALLASILVFRMKKHRVLKTALVLEVIGLLVPAVGYVLAGMSNVNNRWVYIAAFTMSFAVAAAWPRLFAMDKKDLLIMAGITALYAVCVFMEKPGSDARFYGMIGLILVAASILFFALSGRALSRFRADSRIFKRALTGAGMALILVCEGINGYMTYSPKYDNYVSEFQDAWQSRALISDSALNRFSGMRDDESFYRIDSDQIVSNMENFSLQLGFNSTTQYNSTLNRAVTDYLIETDNIGIGAIHRFHHLDARTGAEALAQVRYYMTSAGNTGHVPYGFTPVPELSDDSYTVYENQYLLPFGYSYSSVMSRENYEKLSAADRERAQLRCAVLEKLPDDPELAEETGENYLSDAVWLELPEEGSSLTRTADGYRVKKGGSLSISFEKREGYACYLSLNNFLTDKVYAFVHANTSDMHSTVLLRGLGQMYSLGRTDYLLNLGVAEEDGSDTVTLTWDQRGEYSLESACMYYVPVSEYESAVQDLSASAVTDTVFDGNRITGHTRADQARLYTFAIPYSEGWHLTVDGESRELYQVNTAWMGAVIEGGEHDIELSYRSPGAFGGRILALTGWILWLLWAAVCARRGKKQYA